MTSIVFNDVALAPYSMATPHRRQALINALQEIDKNKIEGDFVECGVWKGGNIILARHYSPTRVCWVYDTFNGMPAPVNEVDGAWSLEKFERRAKDSYMSSVPGTWLGIPLEEVKANIAAFGLYDENLLRFVEGPVEKTLLDPANLPDKIALLRLDTDWYASTKIELEVLYPKLAKGGILIVDDYGQWQGSRKAVNDYFGAGFNFAWIDKAAIVAVKQ